MLEELKSFDLWEQGLGVPPTLPSFYWNVYSYEQRIKEICLRLERMLEYQDLQTDKINECVEQVNKLTEEVDALTKEVARINQALIDEISAREAGDQKLETELQQEINDRIKAINDEATTRQAQVDKLTSDLEAEAEARKTADTTLQSNIDKVASDLSSETTARTEADTALDTRVTQNTQHIADEVTARTNLSNSLTEALTNETTARTDKDKELDQQIADLTADLPSVESENIYTASTKVPTVTAIQTSTNGELSEDNQLASTTYVKTQISTQIPTYEAEDVYSTSEGIATVQGINASSNQPITSTNKIATMADVSGGGGGGGTDINIIAPLKVLSEDTPPRADQGNIAIGTNTVASGANTHSIAIGYNTTSDASGAIAIGTGTNVYKTKNAIAIGTGANTQSDTASSPDAVSSSIAIGEDSSVTGGNGVAIGGNSTAYGNGIAIGHQADSHDGTAVAIGDESYAYDPYSVAIGCQSKAPDRQVVSIGSEDFTRRIVYVSDPIGDTDAVNKRYMDNNYKETITTITNDPTNTQFTISDSNNGLYACTFFGNVPAGTVGDAYGFNILSEDTIIGTVAGFRGSTEQSGVPLIGNVILVGNTTYTFGQEGITSIVARQLSHK